MGEEQTMTTTERADHPAPGVVTDEEQELRGAAALRTAVSSLVARAEQKYVNEVLAELDKLEEPDRSTVPQMVNRNGETVHRLTSPTSPLYYRMSEQEREWRNPDADHWYREWIVGHVRKDHARMLQARMEIERMFGRTALEGAADESGGK